MKKIIVFLAAALMCTLLLAGCGSSIAVVATDSSITVTVKNAGAEQASGNDFTVEEGKTVVFDATGLSKGKMKVVFADESGAEGASATVSAGEVSKFDVPAGKYTAQFSVVETADGSVVLMQQ